MIAWVLGNLGMIRTVFSTSGERNLQAVPEKDFQPCPPPPLWLHPRPLAVGGYRPDRSCMHGHHHHSKHRHLAGGAQRAFPAPSPHRPPSTWAHALRCGAYPLPHRPHAALHKPCCIDLTPCSRHWLPGTVRLIQHPLTKGTKGASSCSVLVPLKYVRRCFW